MRRSNDTAMQGVRGSPRRVLLAGHSLGSIAALQLAETYPGQYDGALVMCGFVGGTTREIEDVANARLIFDYLFPGVIPGTVFEIPETLDYRPGTPLFNAVRDSLIAGLRSAVQDAAVCCRRRSCGQQRRRTGDVGTQRPGVQPALHAKRP